MPTERHCPTCLVSLTDATFVSYGSRTLEEGDMTVCVECGGPAVFTADGGLRLLTDDEMARALDHPMFQAADQIARAYRRRRGEVFSDELVLLPGEVESGRIMLHSDIYVQVVEGVIHFVWSADHPSGWHAAGVADTSEEAMRAVEEAFSEAMKAKGYGIPAEPTLRSLRAVEERRNEG